MTKILAVDDSKMMRQLVTFVLKSAGFETIDASDGVEALNIVDRETVDLVIVDVNMPNMGGIELTSRLRGLPNYQLTPIIVLSTESSSEMRAKGEAAGATYWINKPFIPDELLTTVKGVL